MAKLLMNDVSRLKSVLIVLAVLAVLVFAAFAANANAASKAYVIDVHGEVWPGQANFVNQQLDNAAQDGASAVILDIDTFGGFAQSATEIKDGLMKHDKDYTEVAFVHYRALSSGSLIALSCKYIVMAPGSVLGSAQPHSEFGGPVGTEALSWAHTEFASTAESRGRNPLIARAWVGAEDPIPALGVKEGDILTLTEEQAKANGYCDAEESDVPAILSYLKIPGAQEIDEHMDFWQTAAQYVCQPWMTALILGLGLALVVAEMLTMHSWGIAGIIGGVAVAIVFAAHLIAGTSTWLGILLFLGGIGLILFEAHILPGHGLSVVAGMILVFIGIYYAIGGANTGGLISLGTSLFVMVGLLIGFFGYFSRIVRKLGQPMQQRASMGYVASANYTDLLGLRGEVLSPLRPSGSADIGGIKYNVVSEGSFLGAGSVVEVVTVQGSRIVVREIVQVPMTSETAGT